MILYSLFVYVCVTHNERKYGSHARNKSYVTCCAKAAGLIPKMRPLFLKFALPKSCLINDGHFSTNRKNRINFVIWNSLNNIILTVIWSRDNEQWQVQWYAWESAWVSNSQVRESYTLLSSGVLLPSDNARPRTARYTVKQIQDLQLICNFHKIRHPSDFHFFWHPKIRST
jgi:hypothetical protein